MAAGLLFVRGGHRERLRDRGGLLGFLECLPQIPQMSSMSSMPIDIRIMSLGMHDTSFLLRNDMARRLVRTHMRGSDGKPVAISIEPLEESEFHTGGAGLFSTAPDYVTFTRMLLAGGVFDGVEVLKPETVKLMARNAIGDLNVPMVRSNNPALALEVETFPGQVKKWGLTFLINTEDIEGFRSAGSLTWGGVTTLTSGLILGSASQPSL